MEDVKETGPVGLKGLKGVNQLTGSFPLSDFIARGRLGVDQTALMYAPKGEELVGMQLGNLGYGSSKYDDDIVRMSQADNINEFRAQTLPWYDQLANGAIKMVSTAGTTFIDGTLGTIWGIGTGIKNLADDDPNTGFWRGMWDNAVTNSMAKLNEAMENVAKNYRTEWEQNASFWDRMWSTTGAANFWGDDILKNAGFTMGAAASIWATGATGGLLKQIPGMGKVLSGLGRGLGLATRGAEGGLEATNAGKFASWLGKTFVSTNGEASIEALNGVRDNRKDMENNLSIRKQQLMQLAEEELQYAVESGQNLLLAQDEYFKKLAIIELDLEKYRSEMEKQLTDSGNMIYAANVAALSLSNNLTLGSMIRGGYDNSKTLLLQALKTSGGKTLTTPKEVGEALLKGDLKFSVPDVEHKAAKAAGHWFLTSTQEGLEEGTQNMASATGQIQTLATMNKYAEDHTMLGTMINPDAEEDLISYTKAMGKAFLDNFGSLNSQGWTEVAAGFISGALGVASVHRNSEGNIRPTWQGGIKESWETVTGETDAALKLVELLNKTLTDNKFNERVKHAVQLIAIKRGLDEALLKGDVQAFKNYEIQQLVSDAVFFRDMGMLDDYLEMYKAMANGISDLDVAELKAMAKLENGEASALEKMSDDDIKTLYQDKAKSTLEKVEKALDDYKKIESKYADSFTDDVRGEALMEMSYLNTLIGDTTRRQSEIGKQIDELENKEHITPLEKEDLRRYRNAYNNLEQQSRQLIDTYNEYRESPDKIADKIRLKQATRQKINLYKKALEAIKKYSEAVTLLDVVDVYAHSPKDEREQVLKQAVEQTEGDTKELLNQFSKYMGDVNTLELVIEDKFPLTGDNAFLNMHFASSFKSMLYEAVDQMLSDDKPVLSRQTLKDIFLEKLNEFNRDLADAKTKAGSIKINEESNTYDFSDAFTNGEVSNDDFNILLDEKTGDETWEPKKGSKAELMMRAIDDSKGLQTIVDNLLTLIDQLDKLDELREAGKKKKEAPKEEEKPVKKTKKGTVVEEVYNGNLASEEEGEASEWGEEEGEDGEEELPEQESENLPKIELLSKNEAKFYDTKDVKGKSGIVYHVLDKKSGLASDNIKKALAKKLEYTDFSLSTQEENLRRAKNDKRKKEILEKMQSIIANNLTGDKTKKRVEGIFEKYASLMKPASGEQAAETHDEARELAKNDDSSSFGGNHFNLFKAESLKEEKGNVAEEIAWHSPVKELVPVIQSTIDNYLYKVIDSDKNKSAKDSTPVHYLHLQGEDVIFLGIKYDSNIEQLMPRDKVKVVDTLDGAYVLIGTLSYDKKLGTTKDSFESILNELKDNHTTGDWYVDTSHSNRIKGKNAGTKVKRTALDSETIVRDLQTLLLDKTRNPRNLSFADLGWVVVEGTEDKPKFRRINSDNKGTYMINGGKPGQVYMYLPAANGKYIPVYMETLFFNELEKNTPLYEEITRLAGIIADSSSTSDDRKDATIQLKDLLIFSDANNFYYNDESNLVAPNTIKIRKDGELIDVADLDSGTTVDAILQAIADTNPRINISTSMLERPDEAEELYLKSGVLKTDIAYLGAVNSSFFLYPVDSSNNYIENKHLKIQQDTYTASTRDRVYVSGRYVYTDGTNFYDEKGKKIDDWQGYWKIAYDIKKGKYKPIRYNKAVYYDVNGTMYVDNGHGGLSTIDDDYRNTVLDAKKKADKKSAQKEAAQKEADRIRKEKEKETPSAEEVKEKFGYNSLDDQDKIIYDSVLQDIRDGAAITTGENLLPRAWALKKYGLGYNRVGRIYDALIADGILTFDGSLYYLAQPKQASDSNLGNLPAFSTKEHEYTGMTGEKFTATVESTPLALNELLEGDVFFGRNNEMSTFKSKHDDPDHPGETIYVIESDGYVFVIGPRYNWKEWVNTNPKVYRVAKKPAKQESLTGKNNFTNGTKIDGLKSQKDLENQKNSSTFATVLKKRDNKEKVKQLKEAARTAFNTPIDSNADLIDVLINNHIDITSNDLDVILDIVKNCR